MTESGRIDGRAAASANGVKVKIDAVAIGSLHPSMTPAIRIVAQEAARLEALVAQGTHFVRWGSVDAHPIGVTIGCDNIAGGRMAGEHLIARGATRIGFIGDADDHYPEFRDRIIANADKRLEQYHGA